MVQATLQHMIAGVSGGVTSTLILHPLDLLKIRFAVTPSGSTLQTSSLTAAVGSILRSEGIPGFYKGIAPNVITTGAGWGIYFLSYSGLKQIVQKEGRSSVTSHLLAAGGAGIVNLITLNPITVVKTRLYIQKQNMIYKGTLDALVKIYTAEGITGLYKGFLPGLLGVAHGALQFMLYEEFKSRYNIHRNLPHDMALTSLEYMMFAGLSKMLASVTTYPLQVIRARCQDFTNVNNTLNQVIYTTWRREGVRGFYRGLAPNLLHVTPNICIVFLMYETVLESLKQ